jgi:hypothetical protein
MDTSIRVPLDDETLRRLRDLAAAERRATADQASVILSRAMRRRQPRAPKVEVER